MTTLTITHTERTGRAVTVMLDDQPIGKLKPGTTRHLDITPGTHWVVVRRRKHTSNMQVIDQQDGDRVALRCGHVGGGQPEGT